MATNTARKQPEAHAEAQQPVEHGVSHLPTVHVPHVPVLSVHLGVPTGAKGRVLWWGGLAGLAAFGVVDWPVAGLIAVGSWVAEQYAASAARSHDGARRDETGTSKT